MEISLKIILAVLSISFLAPDRVSASVGLVKNYIDWSIEIRGVETAIPEVSVLLIIVLILAGPASYIFLKIESIEKT